MGHLSKCSHRGNISSCFYFHCSHLDYHLPHHRLLLHQLHHLHLRQDHVHRHLHHKSYLHLPHPWLPTHSHHHLHLHQGHHQKQHLQLHLRQGHRQIALHRSHFHLQLPLLHLQHHRFHLHQGQHHRQESKRKWRATTSKPHHHPQMTGTL